MTPVTQFGLTLSWLIHRLRGYNCPHTSALSPHCLNPIEVADLPSSGEITCVGCGSSFQLANYATVTLDAPTNKRIGKFEVLGTLGHGAFGTVVKARDTELDRIITIKIPRAGNIGPDPQDLDRFLREARSVAQLRFPSIITIHEVGHTELTSPLGGEGELGEGDALSRLRFCRRRHPRG